MIYWWIYFAHLKSYFAAQQMLQKQIPDVWDTLKGLSMILDTLDKTSHRNDEIKGPASSYSHRMSFLL